MDMRDVASFFDDTQVYDAISGQLITLGQLDLYDDSQRDGVGTERRILSYDDRNNVVWPPHKQLTISGKTWIVGSSMPDDFQGSVIRQKAVIQRADNVFLRASAFDWIRGYDPVASPCGAVWTKDMKYEESTSEVRSFYTLWVGGEDLTRDGDFVEFNGRMNYVRNSYLSSVGMRAIEVVELPVDCLQEVLVRQTTAVYDTTTDSPGGPIDVPVMALVMQYFDQYRIVSRAMIKPERGDLQARIAQDDLPYLKVDDVFIIGGMEYRVNVALPEPDETFLVHLKR